MLLDYKIKRLIYSISLYIWLRHYKYKGVCIQPNKFLAPPYSTLWVILRGRCIIYHYRCSYAVLGVAKHTQTLVYHILSLNSTIMTDNVIKTYKGSNNLIIWPYFILSCTDINVFTHYCRYAHLVVNVIIKTNNQTTSSFHHILHHPSCIHILMHAC